MAHSEAPGRLSVTHKYLLHAIDQHQQSSLYQKKNVYGREWCISLHRQIPQLHPADPLDGNKHLCCVWQIQEGLSKQIGAKLLTSD